MFSIERCQQARLSLTRLEFPESCVSKLNLEKRFLAAGRHTSPLLLARMEDNGRVMPFVQELVDNIQPEPYVAFWG
jgi:hypothetical protein